ncbi:hypothetical protein Salat_1448100 [Sesamum alatum]|uniref:Uncharacterized protein n=1 Tax=Sesamum alatum TaxID=300844 RepID=A0AAE1YB50_9LAMI|nr:hypothetical protein Salat_1448100 [Sesamum alatum]
MFVGAWVIYQNIAPPLLRQVSSIGGSLPRMTSGCGLCQGQDGSQTGSGELRRSSFSFSRGNAWAGSFWQLSGESPGGSRCGVRDVGNGDGGRNSVEYGQPAGGRSDNSMDSVVPETDREKQQTGIEVEGADAVQLAKVQQGEASVSQIILEGKPGYQGVVSASIEDSWLVNIPLQFTASQAGTFSKGRGQRVQGRQVAGVKWAPGMVLIQEAGATFH